MTRLSFTERAGYSLGDAASNLYWKVFEAYLLFFYTDIFGIPVATAGTMFLVTRIWDAVNDPLMGIIADRTRTRWGRYRPYLLWCSVPLAGAGVLAFTTPDLDESGKVIYAYVTYTLMMMMYTAINIPYSALMGVMSDDSNERTVVSSFRFFAAFSFGFVVQLSTLGLAKRLGDGDLGVGFERLMYVYGALAVVLFYITFRTTRERVKPRERQRSDFKQDIQALLRNRPWAVMVVLGLVVILLQVIRGSTITPYFKYYVREVTLLGETYAFEDVVGLFFGANLLASVATIPLTGWLSRRFGKGRSYCVLMAISGVLTVPFYWLSPDDVGLMFTLQILIGLVLGPTAPLVWAMYADTADYAEWKTHRRATGLVFSAATFAQKGGGAIGGAAAAYCLAYYGYDATHNVQGEQTIFGMRMLMSWVPGVLSLLAAAVTFAYNLDNEFLAKIKRDLEARGEQAAADSAS